MVLLSFTQRHLLTYLLLGAIAYTGLQLSLAIVEYNTSNAHLWTVLTWSTIATVLVGAFDGWCLKAAGKTAIAEHLTFIAFYIASIWVLVELASILLRMLSTIVNSEHFRFYEIIGFRLDKFNHAGNFTIYSPIILAALIGLVMLMNRRGIKKV